MTSISYLIEEAKEEEFTSLDLSDYSIKELPKNITSLVDLETFVLQFSNVTRLPENFEKLINLKSLVLRHNKLTKLPEKIGDLENLNYLDLHGNNLRYLSPKLCERFHFTNFQFGYPKILIDNNEFLKIGSTENHNLFLLNEKYFYEEKSDRPGYAIKIEDDEERKHIFKNVIITNFLGGRSELTESYSNKLYQNLNGLKGLLFAYRKLGKKLTFYEMVNQKDLYRKIINKEDGMMLNNKELKKIGGPNDYSISFLNKLYDEGPVSRRDYFELLLKDSKKIYRLNKRVQVSEKFHLLL